MTRRLPLVIVLAVGATALAGGDSAVLTDFGGQSASTTTAPAPRARPTVQTNASAAATTARSRGVAWLLAHQHRDGGWSSGAHGTDGLEAASDVATTAFTVMALQRDEAGSRRHEAAVRRGVEQVIRAVETAPEGPKLNTPEGTQIHVKLGPLVDTHMATLMLTEVMPRLDGALRTRALQALDIAVGKVALAQNANGSFDSQGWAPVLSSSIAAQGLTEARAYVDIDDEVLVRSDAYQASQVDTKSGAFDASAGAGVQLYAVASTLRGNKSVRERQGDAAPSAPARRKAAEAEQAATEAIAQDTDGIIAGFGSIGGEEMLSYMMISDSLAEEGGREWREWDRKIGDVLAQAQNPDGSWVGHHCITSRAFTTAGGIMTLTAGDAANQG